MTPAESFCAHAFNARKVTQKSSNVFFIFSGNRNCLGLTNVEFLDSLKHLYLAAVAAF